MIEYRIGDRHYSLSYSDLRDEYHQIMACDTDWVVENLTRIAHTACIICWLKGNGHHAIADDGVIHELIHLMDGTENDPSKAIEAFRVQCLLA